MTAAMDRYLRKTPMLDYTDPTIRALLRGCGIPLPGAWVHH